jgi:hypothetical protein
MKCPKCQAKLLPVDGEMFCLQCGTAVQVRPTSTEEGPALEQTLEPILQEAIVDAVKHPMHFRLPISDAPTQKVLNSFSTMRSILSPHSSIAAGNATIIPSAIEPMVLLPVSPQVQRSRSVFHRPELSTLTAWRSFSRVWLAAFAVFALFLAVNAVLASYYSTHVYPGVRLDGDDLGGVTYSQLNSLIAAKENQPSLTAIIGSESYRLNTNNLGSINVQQLDRQVWNAGRTTPLPLAGVVETLLSQPIVSMPQINSTALNYLAEELVSQIDRSSANAVPMIFDGQAFIIAEKNGEQLDQTRVASEIRLTYGSASSFAMTPEKIMPKITASAYSNDLATAQQILSLKLQIKLKNSVFNPTTQQLGSWITFTGPGMGISVNNPVLAAYITTIPGKFDRVAAMNAFLNGIKTRQNVDYVASAEKIKVIPKQSSMPSSYPLATYSYCDSAGSTAETEVLSSSAASAFSDSSSWAMGGRLKFVPVKSNCNFSISLVDSNAMSRLNSACSGQSSCQSGNAIELNLSNWLAAPVTWTTGIDSYRQQMIDHEVGHWLGFNHASCTLKSSPVPILENPTVVLDGCSPNWYQISTVTQSNKVLPGF